MKCESFARKVIWLVTDMDNEDKQKKLTTIIQQQNVELKLDKIQTFILTFLFFWLYFSMKSYIPQRNRYTAILITCFHLRINASIKSVSSLVSRLFSMDSLYCLGNSLLHCYNTLQQYSENNKNISIPAGLALPCLPWTIMGNTAFS